jgi:hypothetical protein
MLKMSADIATNADVAPPPARENGPRDKGAAAEKDFPGYDFFDDCRMMLRFAVKEGKEPPAALRSDIATLDGLLSGEGLNAISELPQPFLKLVAAASASPAPTFAGETAPPAPAGNPMELLLKVHAGLTGLIAPATPETLRATQPPPGKGWFGGMPGIVRVAMGAAVICLAGFLWTVPPSPPISNEAEPKKDKTTATPTPSPSPSVTPQ